MNEYLSVLGKVVHCPGHTPGKQSTEMWAEEGKEWRDTVSIICLTEQRLIYTVSS